MSDVFVQEYAPECQSQYISTRKGREKLFPLWSCNYFASMQSIASFTFIVGSDRYL